MLSVRSGYRNSYDDGDDVDDNDAHDDDNSHETGDAPTTSATPTVTALTDDIDGFSSTMLLVDPVSFVLLGRVVHKEK